METWETVTMSRKEARRPGLVQLAVAGTITTAAGARALAMSLGSSGASRPGIGPRASGGWSIASAAAPRPGRWMPRCGLGSWP